ncbi:uncharacterized protein LOC127444186 [Myxocyprinus asiaticus]|uniref:uncharacterized protein LOC127444186 n=1 Tax=Myxocyprinus asiaticus TaxID=70543 RepID=UPI0022228B8D|nr:uncharacterized protein LOC127444186 [Myxocyprinus asiaticus]
MVSIIVKGFSPELLTSISVLFCLIFITESKAAVSPVYECQLFNDTFICTGAQYHMYCNTSTHSFHYSRYYHQCTNYNDCDCRGNGNTCRCYGANTSSSCFCQNYDNNSIISAAVSPVYKCGLYNDMYICNGDQYRMYCSANASDVYYTKDYQYCWNSDSWCYGDKYTCECSGLTSSSCSCDNYSSNITITTAVSPVYECQLFNDTYICTGAQYRMYCNTSTHSFHDERFYHQCINYNDCDCRGNGNTCRCYGANTSSSCFCQNNDNTNIITTAINSVYKCGLYNDIYICTGAQYRMYCSANAYDFYYTKDFQYCWNSDSWCYGDKYTCACLGPTSSSFSCDNNSSNITITTAVSPVYECQLFNDTYICTGAKYRMYCNIRTHSFHDARFYHQCTNYNDCDCRGNGNTCRCYGVSTSSSCFCQNYYNNSIISAAVSPVYKCGLYNDIYICTGAQYRMYCSANSSFFYYTRDYQYCWNSGSWCYGDKYTCECSGLTSSSCSCDNYSSNITITTAVSPVYECQHFNDTFICTGAKYRMYCNIRTHSFHDARFYHQCSNHGCDCRGNGNTCRCYGVSTSSSCFCQNYENNSVMTAVVSPVYKCGLYNDIYICTGAQYRMYCSANASAFYYTRYYQYCWNSDSWCYGDKYTCECSGLTSSSCSCDNYSNNITITTAVSPVYECQLFNNTFICTGAKYRMYCNRSTHSFHYSRYYHRCTNYNDCDCRGNGNTCRCYGVSTSSSCFCQNYDNNSIISAAVSPVYKCGLYNNIYICTGAQYRMYCSANSSDVYYTKDYQYCWNSDCECYGDKYTCECSGPTSSSCSCDNYSNNITITTAVSPVYECQLFNDTYICTGAKYRMYCNIRTHSFHDTRFYHQCINYNDCDCRGNGNTCRCYGARTSSSCFCQNYDNNNIMTAAVSPVYKCGLYNDIYICTGAQYRMYCSANASFFYYTKDYQYCRNSDSWCYGYKYTCRCSGPTSSSCSCDNYSSNITITTAVSPVYECQLFNDTFICTGAQYRMYCNTSTHSFHDERFYHQCINYNGCDCRGNGNTCRCYGANTSSSCFCQNYDNTNIITDAVSPVYKCGLYNDMYICNGDQYRMYCSANATYFSYTRDDQFCWNSDSWCYGDKYTCRCYSPTSLCFCTTDNNEITVYPSPLTTGLNMTLLEEYRMEILNLVAVIVGLVFLTLALLTFAFCRWSPGVNNVARINICLSLLLAHLLFLLTQQSLNYIHPNQVLCALISWILHFFFLSSFLWMLIEAVLLFICVKNLSQISSKQREVLSSRLMIVIGYVIALVVVVMSVGLVPEGYGSEKCWIKREKGFIWSFLGPVCIIIALNTILFIIIIVCLNKNLIAEVSQRKQIKIMVFKTVAQFLVLACPWILGFFTNTSTVLEIFFLILNSQQGTFIFLIHCVLNNEIRQQYVELLSTIFPGIKPKIIQYQEHANS